MQTHYHPLCVCFLFELYVSPGLCGAKFFLSQPEYFDEIRGLIDAMVGDKQRDGKPLNLLLAGTFWPHSTVNGR